MKNKLSLITITTKFFIFIPLPASFAQSNSGIPALVHPGIMMPTDKTIINK